MTILAIAILAASYYVSPSGNNANPGTEAQPRLTVTSGISLLSSGDTLYLRGGTYTNDWDIGSIPSGSSTNAYTWIQNYTGESPIIKPQTLGTTVAGFKIETGSFIAISGIEVDMSVTASQSAAVRIAGTAHSILITNCFLHDVHSGHGVLVSSSGGAGNFCLIRNNRIGNSGYLHADASDDHGIYVTTASNVLSGNVIWGSHSHGIHGFSFPTFNHVYGNTVISNNLGIGYYSHTNWVYNNLAISNQIGFRAGASSLSTLLLNNTAWRNALNYQILSTATNTTLENNIAVQGTDVTDSGGFYIEDASKGVVAQYNLSISNVTSNFRVVSGSPTTNGNLFGDTYDVGWVNSLGGNFHLRQTSAAVNVGTPQSIFSNDFDLRSRPQGGSWDMGAFEFSNRIRARVTTP